ncbi:DUF1232 domain-containing protein [candidate division KSB1 bacterium]|nr:DUF1232 domain-containing protein [candidate division KSB1 bacterium]
MKTKLMRQKIKEAAEAERSTNILANAIDSMARIKGISLPASQRSQVINFIKQYIEHVPAILETIETTARSQGVLPQISPMLQAGEAYFFAPVDVIPDHLGLLGLVDDAYLAHSLVQKLSDAYKKQTGQGLIPVDTHGANTFIRGLIGEPHASMLDAAVANTLGGPGVHQSLQSLIQMGGGFSAGGPDPVWGYASMDEIVTTRLGALGVV